MHFEKGNLYHVYNMGNNRQKIFFSDENYLFFLRKIRTIVKPACEILAYCLMPNHFHFMLMATEKSEVYVNKSGLQILSRKIGTMQSSYTQAINKEKGTVGSLFRQKTKAKNLRQVIDFPNRNDDYALTCFDYIHYNPINAGLVVGAEEWKYSSYSDYIGLRNGSLINKSLAFEVLGIEDDYYVDFSYNGNQNIDEIF
ncbi:MAG: transposase [Bacteroidales bacterium]|nr:transposase [Bacteroidales bacterium]